MARVPTFLWHDYETWGTDPAMDRPAQFAAIRTDMELNPVGEPLMLFARPALDMLPSPEACLVTGITPRHAWLHGVPEAEFIGRIQAEMSQPLTCSAGYNSIRFDDEFTRHTLYRNFYDAYEREWKHGNSRWDLIDVVRLCGALRPDGINWPSTEEGWPSYRLEALTAANGIEQQGAHDALVDVRATIDVARLLRSRQPRLFEYALGMRNRQAVADILAVGSGKPVFHISGMFGSRHYCSSVVLPLCMHPTNRNTVIAFDLRHSPADFLRLDVQAIRQRLFTATTSGEGGQRIPIKNIHINKCPIVAPVAMVTPEVERRIQLDMAQVRRHYDELSVDQGAWLKARDVFTESSFAARTDPDAMLYSGGFFSDADKATMARIVACKPEELAGQSFVFEDRRLAEMLFRYKGRNFPDMLGKEERQHWDEYRFKRLTDPAYGATITMAEYQEKLEALYEQNAEDDAKTALINDLMEWADSLL